MHQNDTMHYEVSSNTTTPTPTPSAATADPLNIISDITALANENRGLERDLGNLANYEAPVFIWDEIVLKKGESL